MTNLTTAIKSTKSHLCVGLDPSWDEQPYFLEKVKTLGAKNFLIIWTETVLEAAKDLAPAVKFQSAFFERFGAEGVSALEDSIKTARELGFFTILDAKRGDISTTMQAYGVSAFEQMNADALTVNPYMGIDVVDPLQKWLKQGKYIYLVWLASNPSASALQMAKTGEGTFVELVHKTFKNYAKEKGIENQIGFVFGATKMEGAFFESVKNEILLIPGVGAQGGKVDAAFKMFLEKNPLSLYNVSRGITEIKTSSNAFDRKEYLEHCREKILEFR